MPFFFFLLFFLFSTAFGDWNEDYHVKSYELIRTFEEFNTDEYKSHLEALKNIEKSILMDKKLQNEIKNVTTENKLTIFSNLLNTYIKKRKNNNINDAYFWELSFFFGLSEIVVPSLPIKIHEKCVIIQEKQDLVACHRDLVIHPLSMLKKVTLENYWKTLLLAYILGLEDLKASNIGITNEGMILLFDNESSLVLEKGPVVLEENFKVGLAGVFLDWHHYRMPLDALTIQSLEAFKDRLFHVKEKLKPYFEIRDCLYSLNPILERMDEILNFSLNEGLTFQDFYSYLYPKLAQGLDELSQIVSLILRREVGHGIALYYAVNKKHSTIRRSERPLMQNWVQKYLY